MSSLSSKINTMKGMLSKILSKLGIEGTLSATLDVQAPTTFLSEDADACVSHIYSMDVLSQIHWIEEVA